MNSCHVVNGVGVGGVRDDSMKNRIFSVVVVVQGFEQSRLLCEGLFIRKNCVLEECLRFNVELVKRFRIRISRKFDVLK